MHCPSAISFGRLSVLYASDLRVSRRDKTETFGQNANFGRPKGGKKGYRIVIISEKGIK